MTIITPDQFLTATETYYGMKYEINIEIKAIVEFLKTKILSDQLEIFFHKLTDHHSKKWKSLPDKSVMLDCLEKNSGNWHEIQAEKAWRSLLRKSAKNNMLIVDPVCHFVVDGYGTWDNFCAARDGTYRELTHKDFIERYVSAAKAGIDETPRPLLGHYQLEYGPSFIGITTEIIGDQAAGQLILDGKREQQQLPDLTGFIKTI